jgi:hypothetical protein
MNTTKLESLHNFQVLNERAMNIITGGLAEAESKKKDVSSDSNDSFKNDKAN